MTATEGRDGAVLWLGLQVCSEREQRTETLWTHDKSGFRRSREPWVFKRPGWLSVTLLVSGDTAGVTESSGGMLAFVPLGAVTHSLVQMFLWEKFLERCPGYLYAHCTFQHILPNRAGQRLGTACPAQSAAARGWPFPYWCRGVACCARRTQHNGSSWGGAASPYQLRYENRTDPATYRGLWGLSGGETYHNKAANTIG